MKCFLALALFVGVALGSKSTAFYGWTPNEQLTYKFETEVLSHFPEISYNHYSGQKLTSEVLIQTKSDYTIVVKFVNPKFIPINGELQVHEGRPLVSSPEIEVPESLRSHLKEPFLVHLKRGIVERFFVEKCEPTVVTNIKKSLLAQLQVNLSGLDMGLVQNDIPITGPVKFKILKKISFADEGVTNHGYCLTNYTLAPTPKEESMSFNSEVCKGKMFLTAVKTENMDNCQSSPLFVNGHMQGTDPCYPSKPGCQLTMASSTKYIICGTPEVFTIVEIISKIDGMPNPLDVNTKRTVNTAHTALRLIESKISGFTPLSVSEDGKDETSLILDYPLESPWNQESREDRDSEGSTPDHASLSTKTSAEIKSDAIQKMQEVIEFESNQPRSEYPIAYEMVRSIDADLRHLNNEELRSFHSKMESILSHMDEAKQSLGKDILHQLLGAVGTHASVSLMKDEIEQGNVGVNQFSQIVQTLIRDVKTPNKEVLGDLVKLVKGLKNSVSSTVYHSALNQLSNVFHQPCENKDPVRNAFPQEIYGGLCIKDSSVLLEEYIPYLTSELENLDNGAQKECIALISALGKTGHKDGLAPITTAIEKHFSERTIKRSLAVFALNRIHKENPHLVKPVIVNLIGKHGGEEETILAQSSAVVPKMLKDVTSKLERIARAKKVKVQQGIYKLMALDSPKRNLPKVPFLNKLPLLQESPSKTWLCMVIDFVMMNFDLPPKLKMFIGAVERHLTNKPGCVAETIKWIQAAFIKGATQYTLKEIVEKIDENCRVMLLQEYEDFRTYELIPRHIAAHLEDGGKDVGQTELESDAAFARYRLAGPNPIKIEPCTQEIKDKVALKNAPASTQEAVKKAFKEGRLYALDYTKMAAFKSTMDRLAINPDLTESKNIEEGQKFSMGPIALFEIPSCPERMNREYLVPLVIQCQPWIKTFNPKGPTTFTPHDGIAWKIAKTIVQSVDSDYHEDIVHLGFTHLVQEAFLLSTKRMLPHNHPLFILLKPHFEGTAFINNAANKFLVNPKGALDQLTSQDATKTNYMVGDEVIAQLTKNLTFPALLKERKMDSENFQAPYPYRDDGILIWNALHSWVSSYIDIYYPLDKDIKEDPELQAWVNDLIKSSKITWLEKWDNTNAFLKNLVTATIWTGSAQHAAVNFPQKPLMSYTPAFPLAMYKDAPTSIHQTIEDYESYLPPKNMDMKQSAIAKLLGGIYYTRLGKYNDKGFQYFADKRVEKPLEQLQRDLEQAEQKINARNDERFNLAKKVWGAKLAEGWKYEYLLPSKIPQSVNI